MKVEKINDDQIKITINNDELRERNINLSEFSFDNPEKIHDFFKDVLAQAMAECDFHTEVNTSLSIQVAAVADESIMITVTKTPVMDLFGLFPKVEPESYRKKPLTAERRKRQTNVSNTNSNIKTHIFCFKTLNEFAGACQAINEIFDGKSSAYKLNSKYYLLLIFKRSQPSDNVTTTLREYGQNLATSPISLSYLEEHGELLIGKDAVCVAAEYIA